MLSSSSSRSPAFSDRIPDRYLDTSLDPDEIQLYSYILPSIAAGKYALDVNQTIVFPDQSPEDTTRVLSLKRRFNVQGPKFNLLGSDDILSVHPAPGHSAPNNTLAHVVFKDSTVPWERTVGAAAGNGVFNPTPWLAVLTFTENEVLLSDGQLDAFRDLGPQSHYGTFTTSAGKVKAVSRQGTITTAMDSTSYGKDYQDSDLVEFIAIPPELFQDLFADYTSGQKNWLGTPDLRRYSYMAHVREVHGGFMASTTKDQAQTQYGVVVSLRTAPPMVDRETRMISHLVSLEGLDKLHTNANAKWATLISLHSWHWTCTPPEKTSFVDEVAALGKNIQPLRIPDQDLEAFSQTDDRGSPNDPSKAASKQWLVDRLKAGYTLIPHTRITGEKVTALFRGPLCPVLPDNQGVQPWSLFGTDLQVLDTATGLFNVSYSTAWNLGRTLGIADRAFTTSLLRLRAKIHSSAINQAQLQDVDRPLDITSYLKNLQSSLNTVVQSQSTSALQQAKAINRWYRTPEEKAQTPARRLMDMASYRPEDYEKQILGVLDNLTGVAMDSDWSAIRGWVVDQLFLARVPLSYLVTSAESLPRESIRTFAIDPCWVECVIDGALSLVNHFSQDDDVIRKAIKKKVNDFLAAPITTGPRQGSRPQVPKWGFFLRSMVVTAFPDLKVEVPLPNGTESGLSEVTYMQKLSDDVIICLLDRCPGESTLNSIKITQPGHQQGFSLGNKLTSDTIDLQFRFLPNQPGVKLEDIKGDTSVNKSWMDNTVPPIYHWPSHTLMSEEFARQCVLALRKPNIFEWGGSDSDVNPQGIPSSIVASQLSRAVLKLDFNVPSLDSSPTLEPVLDRSVDPPRPGIRRLFIPPSAGSCQEASVNPLPLSSTETSRGSGCLPNTRLPLGLRGPPSTVGKLQATDLAETVEDIFHRLPPRRILSTRIFTAAACYSLTSLRDKDMKPLTVNGGRLNDLIFEIKISNPGMFIHPWLPMIQLEVIIPVSFSSGFIPAGVNGNLPTLLRIHGTPINPILPTIEPLNRGLFWLYDSRLALGTLLNTHVESWADRYYDESRPEKTDLQLMLVVRMKTRLDPKLFELIPGRKTDGTFILNGAILSGLRQGEMQKRVEFNILGWDQHGSIRSQAEAVTVIN